MYHGVCRCAMELYSPFRAEYGWLIGCAKLSFSCYKPRKETETRRRGIPNCLGKACSVSEEHFPKRENLARFPRNIFQSGKTLPGSRGTFSRVGKPCSVPGEHFPGREIPRCVLRQAFNDSMLVAVISCSPTSGRMRYAPTLSGEILTQNCTIHYRALNEQMVNM